MGQVEFHFRPKLFSEISSRLKLKLHAAKADGVFL